MGRDTHEGTTACAHARGATPQAGQQHITLPSTSTLLKAKIRMAVNRVMATYLGNLEELADEHDEAMGKLIDALPEAERAKVKLADVYGEARFEAIRRHVLRCGNGELRELEEQCDVFLAQAAHSAGTNHSP